MKQKIQKNKKKHKKYFNISDYKSNYRDIGLIACILVLLIYLTIVISLQGSVITDDKTYDIIRKAETGLESDPLIEIRSSSNHFALLQTYSSNVHNHEGFLLVFQSNLK